MRFAIPLLLAIGGCSARPASTASAPPPTTPSAPASPSATTTTTPPSSSPPAPLPSLLPSLDDLAARAPALAPGMREVARGELSSDKPPPTRQLLHADAADTCTRVAIVAQPALHLALKNGRGDLLADVPSSTDTPIGPRGPVCVRKGDAVTLSAEGSGPWVARFVAWASP
ncbi:MAG: hypothetical protein ACLQBL_13065 [Polyangiaceae bacterium]